VEFVARLGLVDAAEYDLRQVALRETDERLDEDEDIGHEAYEPVYAGELLLGMVRFVHLDNDEAGDQGAHVDEVESRMDIGAVYFVLPGGRWLEDEDRLGQDISNTHVSGPISTGQERRLRCGCLSR